MIEPFNETGSTRRCKVNPVCRFGHDVFGGLLRYPSAYEEVVAGGPKGKC